jgi:asparagine synthase (glutamine-hydrolysing)
MCGISGIFNYCDVKPVQEFVNKNMNNALAHRGPDDQGFYVCDKAGIAFSHRRLSIID